MTGKKIETGLNIVQKLMGYFNMYITSGNVQEFHDNLNEYTVFLKDKGISFYKYENTNSICFNTDYYEEFIANKVIDKKNYILECIDIIDTF